MLLHSKPAEIAGIFPEGSKLQISDAGQWSSWDGLAAAAAGKSELPVRLGNSVCARMIPRCWPCSVSLRQIRAWLRVPMLIPSAPTFAAAPIEIRNLCCRRMA